MLTLKQIAFSQLTKKLFILSENASKDEFEEYLTTVWGQGESDNTYEDWISIGDRYNCLHEHPDYIICNMCYSLDPRYPWTSGGSISWELWCYCLARWVRINDVKAISTIFPHRLEFDHRHSFCLSGPSASKEPRFLRVYLTSNWHRIPEDWGLSIVRPEMWSDQLFDAWIGILEMKSSHRTTAGILYDTLMEAVRFDNHQAIKKISLFLYSCHHRVSELFVLKMDTRDVLTILESYARLICNTP
ncbi:hypothetical protein TetV_547 [Tetraselmis virus 1]|uniref:Uncharacterized protein n=1 Tax=Tetraselmis virus 1 TaxID=2060617 RepID=A0A2P0VPB7_9VIRU|nr:hypothetical protein QJ968_gp507 [Tetraselmis virus 1]AUF82629.1 hypothetical protein TetV_547 [Tetraselmis virus 1]